jgi:hypothetical protein
MLGVPKSWVYEQSRRGPIPTVALGRYRRFRAEAIAAMVDQLERGAPADAPDARKSRGGALRWPGAATAAAP